MKKALSVILAMVMVLSVFAVLPTSAKDVKTGAYFDLDVDSPENGGKVNGVELTIVTPGGSYKCTPTYSYVWYGDNNEIIAENQSLESIPAEQLIGKTPRLNVSVTSCWVDYGSGIMQKVNLSTLNKGDYYSMISTSYKGKSLRESVSWAYASGINAIVIGYKFPRVLYPVENVDISIDAPKINDYPSFEAGLTGNEEINGLSRLYANNVRWFDENDKAYLTMESRFKEGYSYTFMVDWELNPFAYYFPPEGFTATVNGKPVEATPRNKVTEDYIGYAYTVSYTFPELRRITGTAGECTWEYDPASGTFTVSGEGSFEYDESLEDYIWEAKSFIVEDGVTSIGDSIMLNSDKLRRVVLPGSVKEIGEDCFQNCENLESVTLAEGLETIGNGVFNEIPQVSEITVPGSVKTIGDGAFGNNDEGFKLIVSAGSAAETYAKENGIEFEKAAGGYIRGDVDKSGKVNVFDASYILKGTTGTKDYPDYKTMDKSSVEFKRADVDASGTVNIFDAAIVLKHATGDKSVEKYGVGREVSE